MLARTLTRSPACFINNAKPLSNHLKRATKFNAPSRWHRFNSSRTSPHVLRGAAITATLATYTTTSVVPLEWLYAVVGGSFIGGSASMFLLIHGRIAGISGVAGRVIDHTFSLGRNANKLASCSQFGFIGGLMGGSVYWHMRSQQNNGIDFYGALPSKFQPFDPVNYSPHIMLLSGLLVGFGTRLGSGCTSGHGICGLARQSIRSVAAVGSFMATGCVTATLSAKYLGDLYELKNSERVQSTVLTQLSHYGVPLLVAALLSAGALSGMRGIGNESIISLLPSALCGFGFSTGLCYSGMTKPEFVRGALNFDPTNFSEHFNPTLYFVLVGGLGMSMTLFPVVFKFMKEPLLSKIWHLPTAKYLDRRLITGSSIFGVGWGLGGVCPGPGIVCLGSGEDSAPLWIWVAALIAGMRFAMLV